jgi:hypothetical protein
MLMAMVQNDGTSQNAGVSTGIAQVVPGIKARIHGDVNLKSINPNCYLGTAARSWVLQEEQPGPEGGRDPFSNLKCCHFCLFISLVWGRNHQAITNQWLIFLQVRQVHVSMESRKNMAYYKPLIL